MSATGATEKKKRTGFHDASKLSNWKKSVLRPDVMSGQDRRQAWAEKNMIADRNWRNPTTGGFTKAEKLRRKREKAKANAQAPETTNETTTPATPATPTVASTGNPASTAESTATQTLSSDPEGVTISDEAKRMAVELGMELENLTQIKGATEAATLQLRQQAILRNKRRNELRSLISRNRRARRGGSRLLMSASRENPGVGVTPRTSSSLSPRMNPRDQSYA